MLRCLNGRWESRSTTRPILPDNDNLAQKRYLTLIVRLLVDARGRLLQGEIVDAEDDSGKTPRRFVGWQDLLTTMRRYFVDGAKDRLP